MSQKEILYPNNVTIGIAKAMFEFGYGFHVLHQMNHEDLTYIICKLKKSQRRKLTAEETEFQERLNFSDERIVKLGSVIESLQNSSLKTLLFNEVKEDKFKYEIDMSPRYKTTSDEFDWDGIYDVAEYNALKKYIKENQEEFLQMIGYTQDTVIPYKEWGSIRDGSQGTHFWFGANIIVDKNDNIRYPICEIQKQDGKISVSIDISSHDTSFFTGSTKYPSIVVKRPKKVRVDPLKIGYK